MGMFVANKVVKLMIGKDILIKGARALILGITFKENCPDVRNTRVVDIYSELLQFGLAVDVYDPWVDPAIVSSQYGIEVLPAMDELVVYDAIILAVAHTEFLTIDFKKHLSLKSVVYDTKSCLDRSLVDARL
jgi:UDP-N-acetyl-D-galactosamine dehydrogenase